MKKVIWLIIVISGFFLGYRVSGIEWGWKYQKPLRPQETFSHKVHENILKKEGFTCVACHPMGLEIEEREEEERSKISEAAFLPGKETCHFCHFNPKVGNIASGRCEICHFNLAEIQPANHNFNWMEKHAVYSKANSEDCEGCHTPRFCEDCHERRDLPTLRVHDRNFRFVHSIEARANPRRCGNCHELISFCVKCHREGGIER